MMKNDKTQDNLTAQYLSARSLQMHVCKECGSVFYEKTDEKPAAAKNAFVTTPAFVKIIAALVCIALLLACYFLYNLRQEITSLETQIRQDAAILAEKEAAIAALKNEHDQAKAQNAFFDSNIALVLEGKAVYHTYQCASFRNSPLPHAIYTVPEAQAKGYAPCKNCHP